ncbi:TniQ family protein [Rhodopseudomonas palustris]|uniref:TniQ family protein n=1 Tax=Rhodopseudomonas palustris TaxID=1076 RepID=UPI000E5B5A99|nr:TniQ family protein [Rhodopseudomonas palustris]QLH71838.1 TniQ family protein [Rhodopseudomonas palustris]RIA01048.1 hypothetical protein D1920_12670 [Rhodopseudomonas palustris]
MRVDYFPLLVSPGEDEPAHALLRRLARRNGIDNRGVMTELTGLSASRLRRGDGVEKLAHLLNCNPDVLSHSTAQSIVKGIVSLRGEPLRLADDLLQKERRVCPVCISEGAYQRFWFELSFVSTCPKHRVALVDACSCGKPLSWDDVNIEKCSHCEDGSVYRLTPLTPHEDVLMMNRWALGRLGVGRTVSIPILDSMPLWIALNVVSRVGVVAIKGYTFWRGVDGYDTPAHEIRAAGFRILQSGRLDQLLDEVYGQYLAEKTKNYAETYRTIYGFFGEWFKVWYNSKYFVEGARPFADIVIANAARKKVVDLEMKKTTRHAKRTSSAVGRSGRGRASARDVAPAC